MDLLKLEKDCALDTREMKKQIDREFKKLSSVDEYAELTCELRARAWHWEEEDYSDPVLAKFYHKTWHLLLNKVAQKLNLADYMDFYYAVDPEEL